MKRKLAALVFTGGLALAAFILTNVLQLAQAQDSPAECVLPRTPPNPFPAEFFAPSPITPDFFGLALEEQVAILAEAIIKLEGQTVASVDGGVTLAEAIKRVTYAQAVSAKRIAFLTCSSHQH